MSDNLYEKHVEGKTSEEILADTLAAQGEGASGWAPYVRVAAEVRSNQELVKALKQVAAETGEVAKKSASVATRVSQLTWVLAGAAIIQAVTATIGLAIR